MEPKWIRQTDGFSCGPVALANALKWAGIQANWSVDRDDFRKLCRTNREYGTEPANLTRALKTWGRELVVVKRQSWKMQQVISHVEGRGACIFDFTVPTNYNIKLPWYERAAHYTTCVDIMGPQGGEYFKFINLEGSETITWVPREWFKRLFMRRWKGDNIWYIRKRRN